MRGDMKKKEKRAVFFDRDGVVLTAVVEQGRPRPPYSVREFREQSGFAEGAREAVAAVREAGFLAILATNQPDLAYGKITREDFDSIQAVAAGLPFNDIFICFHGRDEGCVCKKPKPGMLLAAAKKWGIRLEDSFVVGDTRSDVGAAEAAGCRSIILDAPYNADVKSDFRIRNLGELMSAIGRSGQRPA